MITLSRDEAKRMIAELSPEARARVAPELLAFAQRNLRAPIGGAEILNRPPAWLEAHEQLECWRVLLQYDFKVWWLSQKQRSQQTPGIPDLLARHRGRGLILWVEVKRPTKPAPWTEAQQDFGASCIPDKEHYLVGGEGKLRAWLHQQFNEQDEGAHA